MQFQLLASAGAVAAAAGALYLWKSAASATYLVDFYCLRPPSRQVLLPDSGNFGVVLPLFWPV